MVLQHVSWVMNCFQTETLIVSIFARIKMSTEREAFPQFSLLKQCARVNSQIQCCTHKEEHNLIYQLCTLLSECRVDMIPLICVMPKGLCYKVMATNQGWIAEGEGHLQGYWSFFLNGAELSLN